MSTRKTVLYIAMSLDGYIAKPGDNLDFLNIVSEEGEDYGYKEFHQSVDTVIMGRKTYDWVMTQVPEYPHLEVDSYIITRTKRPAEGKLQFYTGDLKQLISEIKSRPGKNIFIDGGGDLVNHLMKDDLIDEYIISVIPTFVGDGVRLFKDGRPEQALKLLNSRAYSKGLVQLHYTRIKDGDKSREDLH